MKQTKTQTQKKNNNTEAGTHLDSPHVKRGSVDADGRERVTLCLTVDVTVRDDGVG